jgi:hypothetical protein
MAMVLRQTASQNAWITSAGISEDGLAALAERKKILHEYALSNFSPTEGIGEDKQIER